MHEHLDHLAFRFFKIFAQFEYALKAMGYGRASRNDAAEADWDRFSNEVGVVLLGEQDANIAGAVEYLFQNPPKRQVWVNGMAEWREVGNDERSPQTLFAHIRRVRNNLYHGGKFNDRWLAPDRSIELISNSLLLLDYLAQSNHQLQEAIRGNLPN
ncbi:hypothetical protein ACM7T9_00240 [Pseudomonas aeruginosa]